MLYLIVCSDKPDSGQLRLDNRPAHVEYLKASAGRLKIAGPTLSEDGERMTGSMLVIEAENRTDAEDWAAGDPYAKAGLFQNVTIRPWRWTVGNPAG